MTMTNALRKTVEEANLPVSSAPAEEVAMVLVRFHPDSRIWEIGERPESLDKEEWYKLLCERAGDKYQTRAGGRGFFRIPRAELEALKALA